MILSIDVGTTSLSLASLDDNGRFLNARTFAGVSLDAEGRQDADAILCGVREAMKAFPKPDSIAVTGQMHGIVYLDADGNAVSPLYGWQNPYGNRLWGTETVAEYVTRLTGYPAASGYGLVTHVYLTGEGLVPPKAVTLCTIGDYVAMKLAGLSRPKLHCSNAASLGLYDLNRLCFDEKSLKILQIPQELLPETVNSVTEIANGVYTAVGDNQASFSGSVEEPEKTLLINIGTGGQLSCLSDCPRTLPELETRPYTDGKYLLNASSLCGGRAYAMLADFFRETVREMVGTELSRDEVYPKMEILLQKLTDSAEKVTVDTAFSGTRAEPQRRGSISGLSGSNFTPAALADGFLTGIASEFLPAYEALKTVKVFEKLALSGNAVRRNARLREIFISLYNLPLAEAAPPEEAAVGAGKLVIQARKRVIS